MSLEIGIDRFGLTASNLKCFREAHGYETIKPINIIIGRNNVGKSTLIDLIQYAVSPKQLGDLPGYLGGQPKVAATLKIDDLVVEKHCDKLRGFERIGMNYDIAKRYILGNIIKFDLSNINNYDFVEKTPTYSHQENSNDGIYKAVK